MRPLPVPDELVVACNAEETEPRIRWAKVRMKAPANWDESDLGKCNDVEVLVALVGETPLRFASRILVSIDDLESMRRNGYFWLSLTGSHMQPFAVWTDELEADTGAGENVMRGIESACSVVADYLAQNCDAQTAMRRLHDILAPWSEPTSELTKDERPDDQRWDHQ